MSRRWAWVKIAIFSLGLPICAFTSYPFYNAWHDSFNSPPLTATAPPLAANLPPYSTYAIIWIDDFRKPDPLVETVWVAWVPANYSAIKLENLSPGSYETSYSHSLGGIPIESLPTSVQKLYAGAVTLDHTDLGEVADLLGGVPIGQQTVTTKTVTSYLSGSNTSLTSDILIRQDALMQGLIIQLTASSNQISVQTLLAIPSRMTINDQILNTLIANYYPLGLNDLEIRP